MANDVKIRLVGENKASSAIQQVRKDLQGVDQQAQALSGGLRGMAGYIGAAGLATLAVGAVKSAAALGDLGERVQRSEKYFTAFSGSAQAAAANLHAVMTATEGALSTQQAMQASAKLMSMGLASNAEELSKVSRMAVLLGGDTRTASEAIEEFSLLLANQSILRLDTFGISGAKVRQRIDELQKATAGLSREQAFMQAVMEQGTAKVKQLEDAGVKAGTAQDRLRAKTDDLKASLAKLVEKPYTIIVETITKEVGNLQAGLGEQTAETRITKALEQLAEFRKQREYVMGLGLSEKELSFELGDIDRSIEQLDTMVAQLQMYGNATDDVMNKLNAYLAASRRAGAWQDEYNYLIRQGITDKAAYIESTVRAAEAERDAALQAYQAAEAAARLGNNVQDATDAIGDLAWTADHGGENLRLLRMRMSEAALGAQALSQFSREANTTLLMAQGSSMAFAAATAGNAPGISFLEQQAKDAEKLMSDAGRSSASAWDQAFSQATSRIQGYLGQGVSAIKGLLGGTALGMGDIFAPGANGPFENLYRAADVAKLGGASPWAAALGLTQEDARKITDDFQRGIFSEGVIGLIGEGGMNTLINEAKMAELAEKTQAAFSAAIAKRAGVGTSVVDTLLGMTPTEGKTGATQIEQSSKNAANALAGSLGAEVAGKDFAGKIIGYGNTIWGYFEKGIVEKAKSSGALQEAIDGMVMAALAKRGATSNAAKGQGVQ